MFLKARPKAIVETGSEERELPKDKGAEAKKTTREHVQQLVCSLQVHEQEGEDHAPNPSKGYEAYISI